MEDFFNVILKLRFIVLATLVRKIKLTQLSNTRNITYASRTLLHSLVFRVGSELFVVCAWRLVRMLLFLDSRRRRSCLWLNRSDLYFNCLSFFFDGKILLWDKQEIKMNRKQTCDNADRVIGLLCGERLVVMLIRCHTDLMTCLGQLMNWLHAVFIINIYRANNRVKAKWRIK